MTDKTGIEHVAQAIADKIAALAQDGYGYEALNLEDKGTRRAIALAARRAVLESIREPTVAMKAAGAHLKGVRAANRLIRPNSAEVWRVMIDDLLAGDGAG